MLFRFLNCLTEAICKPNSRFFQDSDDLRGQYMKNKGQIKSILNFLFIYAVLCPFINTGPDLHLTWLGRRLVHFIAFICFCRSRIKVFHVAYTLNVSLGQLLFTMMIKNSSIYGLLMSILTPFSVLEITNNARFAIFNALTQLTMINFYYKDNIRDSIKDMSVEVFSDKLASIATLILLHVTIVNIIKSKSAQDIQKQLKLSKLEAEIAYSKLHSFLQTFSHELRNPLNSLLGNLELVLHEPLPPKVQEMVESSKVCADLLLQLINNILDSGKAQAGKLDISISQARMLDLIEEFWRISKELIRRKGLSGYVRVQSGLPSLLSIDSYRLKQVLLNLVGNAIKFTDKGHIRIKFAWILNETSPEKCFMPLPYDDDHYEGVFEKEENVRLISPNRADSDLLIYLQSSMTNLKKFNNRPMHFQKGVLKIIVQDSGCGIKEDDLKKLFAQFSQVSTDPSKRNIGTGLGLYITREICEAMGENKGIQ